MTIVYTCYNCVRIATPYVEDGVYNMQNSLALIGSHYTIDRNLEISFFK